VNRTLIVTAVAAERAAIEAGLAAGAADAPRSRLTFSVDGGAAVADDPTIALVETALVGVGPAAAAAGTARLLALADAAGRSFSAVLSAGIAGGVAGRADPGDVVIADQSIAADLGADSPDGFIPIDELGFGAGTSAVDHHLLACLRGVLPTAVVGGILTVSTVTGTSTRAQALMQRYPGAVAEAMEGFGVATAAAGAGVAFAEMRTIANPIGPRDRGNWRIREALATLTEVTALAAKALGLAV
jgi:futalosine hydrolase